MVDGLRQRCPRHGTPVPVPDDRGRGDAREPGHPHRHLDLGSQGHSGPGRAERDARSAEGHRRRRRAGVHVEGHAPLGAGQWRPAALRRPGQADAERLRGELQRQAPGHVPRPALVRRPRRRPNDRGGPASRLRRGRAPRRARTNVPGDLRATPHGHVSGCGNRGIRCANPSVPTALLPGESSQPNWKREREFKSALDAYDLRWTSPDTVEVRWSGSLYPDNQSEYSGSATLSEDRKALVSLVFTAHFVTTMPPGTTCGPSGCRMEGWRTITWSSVPPATVRERRNDLAGSSSKRRKATSGRA